MDQIETGQTTSWELASRGSKLEWGGGATPFPLLDLESRDAISIPPPLPTFFHINSLSAPAVPIGTFVSIDRFRNAFHGVALRLRDEMRVDLKGRSHVGVPHLGYATR